MTNEPSSYGTGRDLQRRGDHLLPIFALLLTCVVVHGLTHLYLRRQDTTTQKSEPKLLLDELPTEDHGGIPLLQDNCGLGLELSDISEIQQRYWSLPDGAFVEQIEPDSVAYEAGLRSGDLLVRIEDHSVSDAESCLELLESFSCNEELDLVYYRNGEERCLRIPLPDPNDG